MREIKFRAWDKESRTVYWWSIPEKPDGHITTHAYLQGDVVIMQYTGLKDKNGVEIYEGDIVRHDGYFEGKRVAKISTVMPDKWMPVSWYPWIGLDEDCSLTLEVIGNIYENPELLEEKE